MSESTIEARNRILFEQCKILGDAAYCEDQGLVLRANVGDAHPDRWGLDVAQSSAWYAVALAHWCRDHVGGAEAEGERLNRLCRAMCASQDRRADSETYGNIIWRVGWPEVRDRNGVSFWAPEAGLVYHTFRDLLADDVAETLRETLELCIEGLDRHRPRWQYTNIFLLNILSRLTLARVLDREDVGARAAADWDTWYRETGEGGLTEYNSPTYIVTALVPLARMLDFARGETMRAQVTTALELLYADFCWHYLEAAGSLAGAMSRACPGDTLRNSLSNYVAYQQLGAPLTCVSLTAPFVAAASYAAPRHLCEAALGDKPGVVVRAAIPDLDIERETVFGRHFALGVKSGPAYGPQELSLTVAHRARRQPLMFLRHESAVRAPLYATVVGSACLAVTDYPEADAAAAPPHGWSRFVLGPPGEFDRIAVDGTVWDGGYVPLNDGARLELTTEHITMALRIGAYPTVGDGPDTAKVMLWHQYEADRLVVECVAWKPTRLAIAIAVVDGPEAPVLGAPTGEGDVFTADLPAGAAVVRVPAVGEQRIEADRPLLETPTGVWRRAWSGPT